MLSNSSHNKKVIQFLGDDFDEKVRGHQFGSLFFARFRQRRHHSAMSCGQSHVARWIVLIGVRSVHFCV